MLCFQSSCGFPLITIPDELYSERPAKPVFKVSIDDEIECRSLNEIIFEWSDKMIYTKGLRVWKSFDWILKPLGRQRNILEPSESQIPWFLMLREGGNFVAINENWK